MLPRVFLIKALKFLEFLQVLALDGMDLRGLVELQLQRIRKFGFIPWKTYIIRTY
jgi:hypothetical protein